MIQEPTSLTPTQTAGAGAGVLSRRRTGIRLGLLLAAILLLAIPVVMAMASNTRPPTPQNLLGVGASAAPSGGIGKPGGLGLGQGKGGNSGSRDSGPGKGPITIRAISDKQVSLATADGWTRTITVTTTTVITKGGVTVTVADLNVGDEIGFRQTRNSDGSYSIGAINVVTPKASGEVTKVDGNDITIKQRGNTTRVITVTASTVYKLGTATAGKSDVKVGDSVDALGTVSGTTFTATSIKIHLAHAGGQVTAKTSDSITIQNRDGTKTVIHVTSATTYKKIGPTAKTLSTIAVGDLLYADGTVRADGSFDAVTVYAGTLKSDHKPKAPAPATSATPG